jgi:predicted CXXCH cytochrome family protein
MLAAAAAAAGLLCAPARTEINLTRHNLTAGRTHLPLERPEEVCVFCHTPFGADHAAAPQWNRTATSPNTYGAIDSAVGGAPSATTSISVMCLSCHDGAQALNVQFMGPRATWEAKPRWQAGSWFGAYEPGDPVQQGYVSNPERAYATEHPVGMRYAGGGLSQAAPEAKMVNEDFRRPSFRTLNGIPVWWVPTSPDHPGTREKTDVPLYSLAVRYGNSGETRFEPFVECASCHDPHGDTPLFLRVQNAGSALCLACHNK